MYCNKQLSPNTIQVPDPLIFISAGNCSWKRGDPTVGTYAIYAFILPVLSTFGLCANFMNAIVFMRPKMTPSAFTYLAALSWLDCVSCLLITLTALSRSIFVNSTFWMKYDFQWQIPLFGISTGAANLLLAGLSCDRWFFLRHGIRNGCGQPRFCRRKVARRLIVIILIASVVLNIPYFFVFVVNSDGTFSVRELYVSTYYKIHNWVSFAMLTLLPAIFLIIGHIAIIIAFRRWTKQSKLCRKYGICNAKTTQKRYQHQMKLTITIIILIVLYVIGEMPAALTSRKSSLNLLFGGDINRVNFQSMARIEMICLTLNAFQLSINILVYALINPSFMPELFICLREASDFCCDIISLKPLRRCVRRKCCETKKVKSAIGKNEIECGNVHKDNNKGATLDESGRKGYEGASAGDRRDSVNSNWETEPEDITTELDFNTYAYFKKRSTISCSGEADKPKCLQVWSTNVAWNRSNSLAVYEIGNVTVEVEVTLNVLDESVDNCKTTKRHSVAC